MGLSEADLDGFTERGAADDLDLSAGNEAEFAQAGKTGFGAKKTLDDGWGIDGEIGKSGDGHFRR